MSIIFPFKLNTSEENKSQFCEIDGKNIKNITNNDVTLNITVFKLRKNPKRATYKNPSLLNVDLIFFGEILLSQSIQIIDELTFPFIGIFWTNRLINIINGNY